jgi:hypothetical protein
MIGSGKGVFGRENDVVGVVEKRRGGSRMDIKENYEGYQGG